MSKEETQQTIGRLLQGPTDRDAIHVAVAPVYCFETIYPGQHIGFVDGNAERGIVSAKVPAERMIGIADPFLRSPIGSGGMFWMFLYPNTVTGLKHLWKHPAFDVDVAKAVADKKAASEAWLRNFCENSDGPSYDNLIKAALNGGAWADEEDSYYSISIEDGHFGVYGTDAHGEIPSEFWDHLEALTGFKVTERPEYFSCSC
ncbi:hypothetical protein [Bradyrhizobium erythrophlei]|uniref:Uncharacterized protein n=1 Tax=Bradyrhizobium erythrophlei TaxID=1437360 RepID=A0A1M5NC78_9BRAD|nr:hypothetical protein [Bradyrhizobium erythrophlei]SHG87174.1 hypothetical protein SAMN05443248_2933 [Bradyrhizobium erythrophlei]